MKKLNRIAAAVVFAASSVASMAATQTDAFDVSITFTGTCAVKTAASDLAFTYTALATAPANQTTSTVFQCSRGLTPSFSFDNTVGTSNGLVALGTNLTGEGVMAGSNIRYTLTGVTTRSVTGTAATAGAGGTGGSNGSADEYNVAITASMAQQAGNGLGSATAVTQTRTLTISY